MRQIYNRIYGFNGGGFNSKFSYNLDVGPTYREIVLNTNLNNDQLLQVKLTLNGDPIIDVTGEQLLMLEAYKDNPPLAGRFVIPLADNSVLTPESQNLTELVTLESDNLVLEVKTGAATAAQVSAGTVPTMEAIAITTSGLNLDGSKKQRLWIPRIYSELIPAGATGKNIYKNFNRGPRIRRLHFGNGVSTSVTALEIKRDRLTLVDDITKADNDFLLKREEMVPQTGYFHFDPIMSGFQLMDFLQTAGSSFEINPTVSSAGDVPILFETVEAA